MEIFVTSRKRRDLPFNIDLSPVDMPISVLNTALGIADDNKEDMVKLIGNEPGLHPELEKIFAQIAKHNLKHVGIETTGLLPESSIDVIIASKAMVLFKLYRPVLYSEEELQEVRASLKHFAEAGVPVQVQVMIDDVNGDYTYLEEFLKESRCGSILFRLDCMMNLPENKSLLNSLVQIGKNIMINGGLVRFSCGAVSCMYDDATFGLMMKLGMNREACTPHFLFMPDGNMAHCVSMIKVPGPAASSFKSFEELNEYYYAVFADMQNNVPDNTSCANCVTRRLNMCTGPVMAVKANTYLAIIKDVKEKMTNPDEPNSPEHKDNMWRLAIASARLGYHADAVECLEELRRLEPENPTVHYWLAESYWEVDRRTEAEDEYRKCSRLATDNPVEPLLVLYRRLNKAGKAIRSRMLLEEIKKMVAQLNEKAAANNQQQK